jgi:hypothetical protein
MRPNGIESLRAIQVAVTEVLGPEISSLFAQEAAQATSMMVESLAAEWDSQVGDLVNDNAVIRGILGKGADIVAEQSNAGAASLVQDIKQVTGQPGTGSLAISALTAENERLSAALTSLLEFLEDTVEGPGEAAELRAEAYRYLRRLAVRGWSFFDVSGFRERMVKAKQEMAE